MSGAAPRASELGPAAYGPARAWGGMEIRSLDPVGSYAVQPVFSDGHSTGIYSWDYLYELGENQERLWADYLAKLERAGAKRE